MSSVAVRRFVLSSLVAICLYGAASASAATLFGSRQPTIVAHADARPVQLGTRIRTTVAGRVTAIRFYKGPGNTGTHTGSLWDASSGRRLAVVTFRRDTRRGWQSATLARPVRLRPNQTVIVSYHAPRGHFSATPRRFARTLTRGVLRGPASTTRMGNGLFRHGPGRSVRPTRSFRGTAYFVDVIFVADQSTAPPSTSPTGEFPTPETTGSRIPTGSLVPSGPITTSHDGQVIEGLDITGNVRVIHDNVTVRDVRVRFTSTYGLNVRRKRDDTCPVGTRFEFVELDGSLADESHIPIYSPGCGWTLNRAHVHTIGRSVRLVDNNTVTNSYVFSSRTGDSGSHRGAVGTNGGSNNRIIGNVLMCEGAGCSAAIPMYGDFAPVDGMLVQGNLLATTGSACAYGGSLDSKPFPDGSNIRFIGNHFSTRYFPTCGRSVYLSGFEDGVRGNEFTGNVWHETGEPIDR